MQRGNFIIADRLKKSLKQTKISQLFVIIYLASCMARSHGKIRTKILLRSIIIPISYLITMDIRFKEHYTFGTSSRDSI